MVSITVKTRLVFYSSEAAILSFLIQAKIFNINIDAIPICIYTRGIHPDFSNFLGWGGSNASLLSFLSLTSTEKQIRNWVESPTEKIDIWAVDIKVDEDGGAIEKMNKGEGDPSL